MPDLATAKVAPSRLSAPSTEGKTLLSGLVGSPQRWPLASAGYWGALPLPVASCHGESAVLECWQWLQFSRGQQGGHHAALSGQSLPCQGKRRAVVR